MALAPYVAATAISAPGLTNALAAPVTTAPVAGDCLAAWVTTTAAASTITGVSDPVNGSWTAVGTPEAYPSGLGAMGQWFILPNCQALSTSQSVTASFGTTGGAKTLKVIGCAGIASSPLDTPGSVAANGTSTTITATTGTLAQAAELVVAGTVSQGSGGSPVWAGPFTRLGSDQQNTANPIASVSYDVVSATTALTPTGTIASSNWALQTLALKATAVPQAGVYVAGTATAGTGSATLAVPVTTATSAGDQIVVVGGTGSGGPAVTAVNDTKNNTYTAVANAADNAQDPLSMWAATGGGGTTVGMTVASFTYQQSGGTDLGAAATAESFLGGRPLAHNMQKRFTNPQGQWYWAGLGTGASATIPAKFKAPLKAGIPLLMAFTPYMDPTNAYTGNTPGGNTFANEFTKLTQALSDLNAIRGSTPLRAVLYSECNNTASPFNTAAQYAACVRFYGPAFVAAGIPLDYDPGSGTTSTVVPYFPDAFQQSFAYTATNASPAVFTASGSSYSNGMPVQLTTGAPTGFANGTKYYVTGVSGASFSLAATPGGAAINSTSTGSGNLAGKLMSGIWLDYYASAYFNAKHPSTELVNPTGFTPAALAAKADQYNLPFGLAEIGSAAATYVPTPAQVANWLTAPAAQGGQILALFQARIAAGKPNLGVMWWGSPSYGKYANPPDPNSLNGSFPAAVIKAIESLYDQLQATTLLPLTTSDTVTVTFATTTGSKLAQVMGITGVLQSNPIDAGAGQHASAASGTAVSVTSGALAQNGEVLLAAAAFGNAGASLAWTAPMTQVGTILHVTSSAFLGVATNTVTVQTAQTGAGTLGVSAAWSGIIAAFRQAPTPSVLSVAVNLPPGAVGSPYTGAVTASGGTAPYTYSVTAGALPRGLALNTVTGLVTGTPGADFTQGWEGAGVMGWSNLGNTTIANSTTQAHSGTHSLSLTSVAAGNISAAWCTAGTILTNGIPCQAGDVMPVSAWFRADATAAARACSVGGDFYDATGTIIGSATFGSTVNDSTSAWTQATASLTAPAGAVRFRPQAKVAATAAAAEIHYIDDVLVAGVGTFTLTVQATDSASHTATAPGSITITAPPPSITTTNLPDGTKGVAYSQTLTEFGGTAPFTWTIASGTQPAGLTLSSAGVLSGTPTTFGAYSFTVQLTDANGLTDQATYLINIPALEWVAASLPPGGVGKAYNNGLLQVAGGTPGYTWALISGALPPGLVMGASPGAPTDTSQQLVSGTPTAPGTYTFTIQATDSAAASITMAFTVVIFLTLVVPPAGGGPWRLLYGPPQPAGGVTAEIAQAQNKVVTLRADPSQAHEVSFDVDGTSTAALAITELSTDLIVMFGSRIVFCGRIAPTQDTLDASQHRVTFTAYDYRELLRRRAVLTGDTLSWTTTDAGLIAWNMLQGTQGRAGGGLGIARGLGASTGISRTFGPVNLGDYIGDNITTLAQLSPGFEWQVNAYTLTDLRLDLFVPYQGNNGGVVLAYGDPRISSIQRTVDPSTFANSLYVTSSAGALTPQNPTAATIATDPAGRWDNTVGTDDATIQTLQDHATALLNQAQVVTPSYQIVLTAGAWSAAGGPAWLWLGDIVTVQINSGRLQVNDQLRVAEMAFALSVDNVETLTLTVGQIPFRWHKAIPDIQKRLRYLETR